MVDEAKYLGAHRTTGLLGKQLAIDRFSIRYDPINADADEVTTTEDCVRDHRILQNMIYYP